MSYVSYPPPPATPVPFQPPSRLLKQVALVAGGLTALTGFGAILALADDAETLSSSSVIWIVVPALVAVVAGRRWMALSREANAANGSTKASHDIEFHTWWESLNDEQRAQFHFDQEQAQRRQVARRIGIAVPDGYVITDSEYITMQGQANLIRAQQESARASWAAAQASHNAAAASRAATTAASREANGPRDSRESVTIRDNRGNYDSFEVTRNRHW